VRRALGRLAVKTGVAAVGGALLLAVIVYRRWRPAAAAGGVAVVVVAASYAVAAATFDPHALAEPRFYGLLSDAPALVGDAREIVTNFDRYGAQLARLTGNVTRLYDAASTLPTYEPDPATLRVLHVSDIHDNPEAFQIIRSVISQFHIDAVIDSGDITDHGSRVEDGFVLSAGRLGVPYVWIRGNHDSIGTQRAMSRQRAVVVLDGQVREVLGLRVFGIGDPRFTPDKTTRNNADERQTMRDFGEQTAGEVRLQAPVDIAVVHDPAAAVEVLGAAPVVLTGHLHKRVEQDENGSIMLVEGSTGGAGLRGLEGEDPTPLECSVLYFDRVTHRLQAYDEITIGGLGTSSARIARHVVAKPG
jgi:predicted phosphodiesterase